MTDLSQYTEQEQEWIEQKRCVCGCQASVATRRDGTLYVDRTHAQRRYRKRLQQAATTAGLSPSLTLKTIQAANSPGSRNGDAPTPRKARQSGVSIRVSYRKAVKAVGEAINDHDRAQEMLMPLLTERQKGALRAA